MHLPVVISDQTIEQAGSNEYLATLTANSTGWNVHVEAVCSGAHWEAYKSGNWLSQSIWC